MKKAAILLLIMITGIVNTNSANKKTNPAADAMTVTTGDASIQKNTVCNEDMQHDITSYKYIYAGMPVVYNCY